MNVLSHLMEVDLIVLVTMIFLSIFLHANDAYDHDLNIHIKRTIWLVFILAFFDTMDAILADLPEPTAFRAIFYGARCITLPFLLMSAVMIFRQYQFSRKERIQLILPAMLNALIILTTFFNPYVFSLDEGNGLHRYFFGYMPYLASCYYFFIAFRISRQQRQRGFEEEWKIIFAAAATMLVSMIGDMAYGVRGVLCGTIGLAIAFYYMYRHMDNSRRDTLTGAFNRASFFSDLAKMRPEQMTAFCEFDMNNLKEINDKQGHIEGDKAIVAMYSMIQECLPTQSHLYRFGGDEFAVLFYDVNMSTVYSTVYRIREEFDKSNYGCAIGIAEWKEGDTFREVYNLADEQMYEDKKKQKAKAAGKKAANEIETE